MWRARFDAGATRWYRAAAATAEIPISRYWCSSSLLRSCGDLACLLSFIMPYSVEFNQLMLVRIRLVATVLFAARFMPLALACETLPLPASNPSPRLQLGTHALCSGVQIRLFL
jgi:hypothetical protein